MKIERLDLHSQRNAGHSQFLTDFRDTVLKYNPSVLLIDELFARFESLYTDEGVALVAITKSATTVQIEIADKDRDSTFRGLADKVQNGLNHFNPAVRDTAKRVLVIFDSYGNLVRKPQDEESGLIKSLIADLRTKISPNDLMLLEIIDWVAELERRNNSFIKLQDSRNSEEAKRTELRMKQVRSDIDPVYKQLVERINALILVNGEAPYADFVKEVNARINRAHDAIAQSRANRKKTDETEVKA